MKALKIFIGLLISWFLIHEIIIVVDGVFGKPIKSEYAVIFGNQVHPDGTLSKRLKSRVDRGLELYNQKIVNKIFVSGGLGKEGIWEAQAMSDYLIRQGIPKSDIIIDDYGNTTRLTALNFKSKFPQATSAIVVTQFYHVSRSKLALEQVGVEKVSGASADYFEWRDLYSAFREFFAYYKYLAFY